MTLRNAPSRRLVHDQAMPVEAIHLGAPRKPEPWMVDQYEQLLGRGSKATVISMPTELRQAKR
jgi:hypothetical protein